MNDDPARPRAPRGIFLVVISLVLLFGGGVLAVLQVLPRVLTTSAEVQGEAQVVTANRIRVGDVELRLKGIDAPVDEQTCEHAGQLWHCGREAAAYLASLVKGQRTVCRRAGIDRRGRVVGICRVRHGDVGALMVRDGWAVALDTSYLTEETEASRFKRGLWRGEFERPRSWRRKHRPPAL